MRRGGRHEARRGAKPGEAAAAAAGPAALIEAAAEPAARFRPPSRRTFVAMLGAAVTSVVLRDRLTGRAVIRNPDTGKPIWIGHV